MKKILEIGGGTTPYFIRFNIPWKSGDAYVCLDMNEKRLQQAQNSLREIIAVGRTHPTEAEFLLGDGLVLPFADASHDDVVLSNVLSAPIHYFWNKAGDAVLIKNESGVLSRPIHGTKSDGDLFYRERVPVIQEALRVLKPGGTLHIYTDLLIYGQHSYEKILRELKENPALSYLFDEAESKRIDTFNLEKKASGSFCYCFDADVLSESAVHRFLKREEIE